MKWTPKERPWSYRKFAIFPTEMTGGKDWVWLEHYWEGCIGCTGGTAVYRKPTREALHQWCNVPLAKQDEENAALQLLLADGDKRNQIEDQPTKEGSRQ